MVGLVKDEDEDTTQVWIVGKDGKTQETDKWHMFPTYRLELTVFYSARHQQPSRKTTVIKKDYENWDSANAAALELAKSCRSSGESVMLVKRKEGDIDVLHEFAVGVWNWKDDWSGRVPCKWSLIHDWERERWYSHRKGDISGYLKVIRWWKKPLVSAYEDVALENLKSSDDGLPPPGLENLSSYEFKGYHLCNTRTWQPVQLLAPFFWLQPEERAELSSMVSHHTLRQFSPNAWRAQSLSNAIEELERNTEQIRLAFQQPRDLRVQFHPDGPNKTKLENPTAIAWRLSKKSVVARDLETFELKLRLLELQQASHAAANLPSLRPNTRRTKTVNGLKLQLSKLEELNLESDDDDSASDMSSRLSRPPEVCKSPRTVIYTESMPGSWAARLIVLINWMQNSSERLRKKIRKYVVIVLRLPRDVEGPVKAEKLSDPNVCRCTAHLWRQANFPRHKRLPAVPQREDVDLSYVPEWARDPTYVPRHVQHWIEDSTPEPEPTTLCGYIRRQLETGWPVPRQKYIDFSTMTEPDCRTRWGPDWRLQDQKEQAEWDSYRNVRKQQRKVSVPKTGEPPEDELWGYDGCVLEHETPCRTLNQLGDNELEIPSRCQWDRGNLSEYFAAGSMVVIFVAGILMQLDIVEVLLLCNMV